MDMEELEALKGSISDYLRPSVDTIFDWDRFSSFLELVLKELEEKRQERLLEKRCLSNLLRDLKLRLEREIVKTLNKNAKYRARISLQYNFNAGTDVIWELIETTSLALPEFCIVIRADVFPCPFGRSGINCKGRLRYFPSCLFLLSLLSIP
ncbi:hypothetical protein R1flu_024801 [Riccia fluitans]|uniref:Uncharacterized protein n=1 Tax=Riccia fluitans TaxID=41844 RepID=A0ABD1XWE8_9MARC